MITKSLSYEKLVLPFAADKECHEVVFAVQRRLPGLNLRVERGFFVMRSGEPADHSWLVDGDGVIVDPTYSQFDRGMVVGVWERGAREHGRYHSYQCHHAPDCLHKLLKTRDPCALYDEGRCDYRGDEDPSFVPTWQPP